MYTAEACYELTLLMLCIWREARGESADAQHGVGWTIRNRKEKGGWFGSTYAAVVLKPWQFSSFNPNDPNASKLPNPLSDQSYGPCLIAAKHVYEGTSPDPTGGATHYYDDSLANNPPSWAKSMTRTAKIGRLNFFKEKV